MKTKLPYLIIAGAFILSSCEKEYYKPDPAIPMTGTTGPAGTTTVSFAGDILPIFQNGDCQGCHPGLCSPDLSNGNAFTVLTTRNSTTNCSSVPYVNTASPATSLIYTKLLPSYPCGEQMGVNEYGSISGAQINKILAWIQQGAQNN